MYLVVEPVRLLLEAFGTYDKRRLSTDVAQKRPKFDGFTLLLCCKSATVNTGTCKCTQNSVKLRTMRYKLI